jgi:two-component system response regulator MprA
MSETILIVEDDHGIADTLRRGLIFEGYRVTVAYDGEEALNSARDRMPDLVVLDWMLPGLDGLDVCKRLRAASDVPILMLTAKDSVADRVEGLDTGADDYLVKPFAFDELLARIRALLRRAGPTQSEVLHFADLELDTGTRQARRGGKVIELTAKEYDFGGESNIIEVYVRYLRRKLEANGLPRIIHTVRGVGYVLRLE